MATHAEQMVTKLETLLLSCAGLNQVTIDGATLSLADLEKKLAYWKGQVARANGSRPRAARINLSAE